ncbi:MAG: glycosyltransferase family 39 protein [Bacteroidia bacterium]|nr:glycosyltransferase family 39 protein [Bacteroidia bacterium]
MSPMLNNTFTNWDDQLYVINNKLLQEPDWKGIFSRPVVSNYHPLTILSLAFNYQISKLSPDSYYLFNLLLHLANTALVFYFIWNISGKKIWAAVLTALLFGIHPMHVESVAWVSERKDVLYTFFFIGALIMYWQFIQSEKKINYFLCFLLFALSLLSKPAAIVLPLVLLLLDYWKGRAFNKKILIEKIPFFLASVLFAAITLQIQSHKSIASLDMHPLGSRLFFACYVVMIYFTRFLFPYPLSTFHPYPSHDNLGLAVYLSPLFIAVLVFSLLYLRKNKLVVFSILFFVTNLLLVLQIIAIGNTIVSERYTYVPYIGLAFLSGMLLNESRNKKALGWVVFILITFVYGTITFQRTKVWKDSETLWTDVIKTYPNSPVPRTNRSNVYSIRMQDPAYKTEVAELAQKVLDDCNIALKNDPKHVRGYEDRGIIYLSKKLYKEALEDGDLILKLDPRNKAGYSIRGTAYMFLNEPEKAIADYTMGIELYPENDFYYGNRGTILFNRFQKYTEARTDFDKAISLKPDGNYYLNRSNCNFMLGDTVKAKNDLQSALQMGLQVPEAFKKRLNM